VYATNIAPTVTLFTMSAADADIKP